MKSAEIIASLNAGKLPCDDFDGSGRGLMVSDEGEKFFISYRHTGINDWKVLSWRIIKK